MFLVLGSMVGDVNLFLNDADDRQMAEIEVMIAEQKCRGRGLGRESVLAMIFYGMINGLCANVSNLMELLKGNLVTVDFDLWTITLL